MYSNNTNITDISHWILRLTFIQKPFHLHIVSFPFPFLYRLYPAQYSLTVQNRDLKHHSFHFCPFSYTFKAGFIRTADYPGAYPAVPPVTLGTGTTPRPRR